MKLKVLRAPPRRPRNAPPPAGPLSPKLRVTLANTSDAPLVVVDFGEHCSFHLLPVEWAPTLSLASAACDATTPSPADVTALAPGETHSVELDLAEPRWHVVKDGKPTEIGALPGLAQFRIEYRAPAADVLTELHHLWRGRMASPAFNANGIVD